MKRKFYGAYHLKATPAWKTFSEYVRRKSPNCFACGRRVEWKKSHASHYIAGSVCGKELFFSEINVQKSCVACNLFLHGNLPQFALHLQEKYGDEILKELDQIRLYEKNNHILCRFTPEELKEIEKFFTARLAEIK